MSPSSSARRTFTALAIALSALGSVAAAAANVETTITTDVSVAANKTFDYVIVGGGLSGLTVGNKLSGQGYSVLVIEAGPDARNVQAIYNAEDRSNLNGTCNWQYQAYDANGTALSWKIDSGKCLGGSTSINGMVWYRPVKAEIDMLEKLGNTGWNWDSLEPYMEAIEHNNPPDATQISQGASYDPAVHGYNGQVNVSFPTPMRIPAAVELYKETLPTIFPGLTRGNDLSNRTNIVSASTSWTIWYDPVTNENRRSSAAFALLYAPDQQRASLTVLAEHVVGSVVLSKKLQATGVTFGNASENGGVLSTVYARKEVILAAGSLGSAPILERSGVGNSAILKKAGIKQLVNLPGVGMNLNDQPGTSASATVLSDAASNTSIIDGRNLFAPDISLVNIDEIFTSDAHTIAKSLNSGIKSRAKAIYKAGAAASVESATYILTAATDLIVKSRLPVAEFVGESYPGVLTAVWWPLLPLSRGFVHTQSSDPYKPPMIAPRLLTDAFDLDVSITIARRARSLFQTQPIAGIVDDALADPSTSSLPSNATDAEIAEFVKSTSYGASHWIGSTAMLPRGKGGVVDPRLRVYGVSGLRVVDAGVIPYATTAHTMPITYSIAQKAADLILADA